MKITSKEIPLDEFRTITFRSASPEDDSFLLSVYASTRLEELALTNWDEAQRDAFLKMQFSAQQSHYCLHYPEGEHLIILVGGVAVGRLYIADITAEVRILDITLLPQHRNTGIGTTILKALMTEASSTGKPLRIYVESYNPSQRLFERLGFVRSGESGYNYLLEWRA